MSNFHPRPVPVPYAVVACCERAYNEALAYFAKGSFYPDPSAMSEAQCQFLDMLAKNLNEAVAGHREWMRIHSERLK